jgi:hypothetical protein
VFCWDAHYQAFKFLAFMQLTGMGAIFIFGLPKKGVL